MVDYSRINNTLGKMGYYLATHECICVGVSGGSDSNVIVHMIATHFREYLPKVHFVHPRPGGWGWLFISGNLHNLRRPGKYYFVKMNQF